MGLAGAGSAGSASGESRLNHPNHQRLITLNSLETRLVLESKAALPTLGNAHNKLQH